MSKKIIIFNLLLIVVAFLLPIFALFNCAPLPFDLELTDGLCIVAWDWMKALEYEMKGFIYMNALQANIPLIVYAVIMISVSIGGSKLLRRLEKT